MHSENIMRWKKKKKILKLPWNILYKNNGNVCVSKYTANENLSVRKTKQNRPMLLTNCATCGKQNFTFIKTEERQTFGDIWND